MIDLIDVIEVFEETTLYCCGLLYLSLILTRYKVYNLRGKQVENKLLKTQVARCAKKMLMLVDGFSPNGPTTCETLDLLSWGPYSQSINDWYLGTFEFGHSESTLDPNVSFWTKLCVLDPINLFKRPKDQFLTNADALLLGFEQVLVGHWIGGKNREAKFLNFCPYRTWRNSSNFVTNLMLFFCPGLHLLRFLDTDTARKKTIQQIIRKHDMCVCVCDDSVIFSSMFCEKPEGMQWKKHVALSYDANPDGYEKSWCAAKAWTHRFPFVPAGNECKPLWIPL